MSQYFAGDTSLIMASMSCKIRVVQILLDEGADKEAKGEVGEDGGEGS